MGLAACKEIVHLLQGDITYVSGSNNNNTAKASGKRGTTFTVRLPLKTVGAQQKQVQHSAPAGPPTDDNNHAAAAERPLLGNLLRREQSGGDDGISPRSCSSGRSNSNKISKSSGSSSSDESVTNIAHPHVFTDVAAAATLSYAARTASVAPVDPVATTDEQEFRVLVVEGELIRHSLSLFCTIESALI